jgi:putative DNA primase/helicase
MVGPPGIGKGWISHIMTTIFGIKNVAKAPLTVLERPFNADIAAKQLFIVEETDEIGGNNQRVYNNLKDLITNTTIRLERKGVDAILIDNCLNIFLTGNQVGIFKLDSGDRRFAVLECVESVAGEIANNPDYWDRRWEWVDNGGAEAIYAHLLLRDLAHFNPKGMAPMTSAKQDMVELTHSSIELWLTDLREAPDDILMSGQSEVDGYIASAKELMWLYLGGRVPMHDIERSGVTKMNSALKNARFEPANDGKKIKDLDGYPTRYFIVRPMQNPWPVWTDIVRNRLFWQRLRDSSSQQSSQPDSAGYQDTKY